MLPQDNENKKYPKNIISKVLKSFSKSDIMNMQRLTLNKKINWIVTSWKALPTIAYTNGLGVFARSFFIERVYSYESYKENK